jgi:hypothetical protein
MEISVCHFVITVLDLVITDYFTYFMERRVKIYCGMYIYYIY